MGVSATERLIDFCMPGLKVSARRAPLREADVCVPNLRRDFEALNDITQIYGTYQEFLDALEMFIPATITEKGIYTNITYTREALAAFIEAIVPLKQDEA